MLELIDFLERLAPFSEPDLLVRDNKPLIRINLTQAKTSSEDTDDAEMLNDLDSRLLRYIQ